MGALRGFGRRFRFPWRSIARIRRDIDDEIAFHLATKIDALQREGLSLDEAREEALRQFGDVAAARRLLVDEDRRAERASKLAHMLDALSRDLRFAWRSLWRSPGFTVVAVTVLGLGIGVVAGAFSLINVYALKPVLIADHDEVVGVFSRDTTNDAYRAFTYTEYVDLRAHVGSLSQLAAYDVIDGGVEEGDITRRAVTSPVSANYFETVGIPPVLGRSFTLAEERGDDPAVAVVSHEFWIRNGADPDILGSTIRINGVPHVVVGVAARGFTGTMALLGVDVWVPLASTGRLQRSTSPGAIDLLDPQTRHLMLFGRLADGGSVAAVDSELAGLAPGIEGNRPADNGASYTYFTGDIGRFSISIAPNPDDGLVNDLLVPAALASIVLLIACLNLANMFLARGSSRTTEIAIRQSLGSGRGRIVRQLLTEALLLSVLGGIVGLIWSYWATTIIAAALADVVPLDLTFVVDLRPDTRVLLATVTTCGVASLLSGLVPAWRVTGTDVLRGLKHGAGAVPFGRGRMRALASGGGLMIVTQIALSLVMLTAGGLFIRSALVAANAAPNFSLDDTLVVEINPGIAGFDETQTRAVYARLLERLRAMPGTDAAGVASLLPLSGLTHSMGARPAGSPPDERGTVTHYAVISDGYFDSYRLPMLRGRDFTDAEIRSDSGTPVAIIDEQLAERLFPAGDALGRSIRLGPNPNALTVVGIAPALPGAEFSPAPRPHVYVPFGQNYLSDMYVTIAVDERVADPASLLAAVRAEIREIDPSLPVLSLQTMRELRDSNWGLGIIRIGSRLFSWLGVMALFLAMVGLYGAKAFVISRRTREIGVRLALGATRGEVLRHLLHQNIIVTFVGLVLGWILALAVAQILSSLLFGISGMDALVFVVATVVLASAATLASWLPARRATRIEPTAALRYE